jgi:hypothetical protein
MTRALVLFGVCALTAGTALAQVPLWESTGAQPNDGWGWASDSIGDLNGDGRRELVVSSSPYGPAQSGRVEVLSGATGAVLMSLFSPASNDRFGEVVARVGRVDADAFDDFLVSAPASSSAGFFAGTVRVYSGASGGVLHQFDGASQGDRWGSTADGCGDINGDGHDDIIVGSAVALQHSVKVYSGLDGSVLHTLTEPATQFYGIHVAGVGDVDNDGRADFAITSTIGAFTPGGPSAFVDVHSGASGARIVRLNGGYLFGLSVDGVGDVDNDGFDDIVVGEQGPASEPTPSAPGKVIVYSSRLWSVLHTFRGHPRTFAPGYDALGWRVQGVGDVDGDGRGDVGAIAALGQYARIWSSTSGALLTEYREHVLPSGFSLSSFSLAGLGDIDGDGRAEVAFSWSGSDAPGVQGAGRVRAQSVEAIATPIGLGDGSGAACPCGNVGGAGEGCANSTGKGVRLHTFGSTSIARDDLYFFATGAPTGIQAKLVVGATTLNAGLGVPMFAGLRAAGAPLSRIGAPNSFSDGSIYRAPGLQPLGAWSAGQVRVFQIWYRDASGPCGATANFSSAAAVTFTP